MKLYFFTELSLNKTKFSKITFLYLELTDGKYFFYFKLSILNQFQSPSH